MANEVLIYDRNTKHKESGNDNDKTMPTVLVHLTNMFYTHLLSLPVKKETNKCIVRLLPHSVHKCW